MEKAKKGGAFRAPPPSPIARATGSRSTGVNSDILNDFLESSLRIPDLILPDAILPSCASTSQPQLEPEPEPELLLPQFDLATLRKGRGRGRGHADGHEKTAEVAQALADFGCFGIIGGGHGVPESAMDSLLAASAAIFDVDDDEAQAQPRRSKERPFGFDDGRLSFCVPRSQRHRLPHVSPQLSDAVGDYWEAVEQLAGEILEILEEKVGLGLRESAAAMSEVLWTEGPAPLLCMYKCVSGSHAFACTHLLALHHAPSSSSASQGCCFYIYRQEMWTRLALQPGALLVTAGPLLKLWSDGRCRSVTARAMATASVPTMAAEFLYTPPSEFAHSHHHNHHHQQQHLALPALHMPLAEHLFMVVLVLFVLRLVLLLLLLFVF